jgi:hypothetical protein
MALPQMDYWITQLRVGLQAASPVEPKAVVEACRMANVLAVNAVTWTTLLMGGKLERPCIGGGDDSWEEVDGSDGGGAAATRTATEAAAAAAEAAEAEAEAEAEGEEGAGWEARQGTGAQSSSWTPASCS